MYIATTLNPIAAAMATLNREIHIIPDLLPLLLFAGAAAPPCKRDNVRFGGWFLRSGGDVSSSKHLAFAEPVARGWAARRRRTKSCGCADFPFI
jgi:hypothetical protein